MSRASTPQKWGWPHPPPRGLQTRGALPMTPDTMALRLSKPQNSPSRPGAGTAELAERARKLLAAGDLAGYRALFGDERSSGSTALRYTTSGVGPDGSIWLGTGEPVLIHVTADLSSAARICLPRDVKGMAMTSMAVQPSGRLILGMSPALLGFGRWRVGAGWRSCIRSRRSSRT